MVAGELQQLVDALASPLGRAVEIYDARLSLLAYSAGQQDGDPVRLRAIIDRRPPAAVRARLLEHGIRDVAVYVRVPADPDLRMRARVCVPIRCQQLLLGHVSLIENGRRLDEEELEAVVRAARHAGQLLYRHRLLLDDERAAARRLSKALCADDAATRVEAADELLQSGRLAAAASYCAVVARVEAPPQTSRQLLYVAVGAALERARRVVPPHTAMSRQEPSEGLVVLGLTEGDDAAAPAFAEKMLGFLVDATAELDRVRVRVGIGASRADLHDVHASLREARTATDVAASVPELGNPVSWSSLGSYRMIAGWSWEQALDWSVLPAGLSALLDHADSEVLTTTLECYLDRGGDAQATSAELFVHRTSLYGRLRRIEAITGLELRDGDDRLALHLGLRMLRLAGRLRGGASARNPAAGFPDKLSAAS